MVIQHMPCPWLSSERRSAGWVKLAGVPVGERCFSFSSQSCTELPAVNVGKRPHKIEFSGTQSDLGITTPQSPCFKHPQEGPYQAAGASCGQTGLNSPRPRKAVRRNTRSSWKHPGDGRAIVLRPNRDRSHQRPYVARWSRWRRRRPRMKALRNRNID